MQGFQPVPKGFKLVNSGTKMCETNVRPQGVRKKMGKTMHDNDFYQLPILICQFEFIRLLADIHSV